MQTFHLEMLAGNEFEIFQIYHRAVLSILLFARKMLLRNCPIVGTTFWIAPFSSVSKTSCSTYENYSFDIYVKFGIFS